MAKFKKTANKRSTSSAGKAESQAQAERLAKSLSESAQQIWLAGVGAFGRAQAEGTRLFDGLVKEGLSLENTAKRFAGKRADVVRDAVESRVDQARGRAADTWDRLEKVFEDRVQKALVKLGVPAREDLRQLSERVDRLTAELRRQRAPSSRSKAAPASPPTPPRKTAKRPAARAKAAATAPAAGTARTSAPSRARKRKATP